MRFTESHPEPPDGTKFSWHSRAGDTLRRVNGDWHYYSQEEQIGRHTWDSVRIFIMARDHEMELP